jgi:hypothetical protein
VAIKTSCSKTPIKTIDEVFIVSDTIPDVTLASGVWLDLYTATGISPASDLVVKNKSSNAIYIQVRASTPPTASIDGWQLSGIGTAAGGEWTTVTKVPAGSRVWAKGNGKLFVQVLE